MKLTPQELDGFSGTEQWYRWSRMFPWSLLTDGSKYVAENGAAWLMDAICSHQTTRIKRITPQFWSLQKTGEGQANLVMERDENDIVITQEIPLTDFPLDNFNGKFRVWASWDSPDAFIIFLPSEY
jgi:hypothetical protein